MSIHSVHIPFYSRPLSVGVSITFFRPLFVCFLCIHPTVASGRFPRLLERGRDHFRPMQEERWRRPSSRFIPRWRRSLSLPPSSPPPPPPLATSLYFRWEWRRTLRQSSFAPLHSHRFLGDVGIMIVCVGVCMEVWVCSLVSLVLFFRSLLCSPSRSLSCSVSCSLSLVLSFVPFLFSCSVSRSPSFSLCFFCFRFLPSLFSLVCFVCFCVFLSLFSFVCIVFVFSRSSCVRVCCLCFPLLPVWRAFFSFSLSVPYFSRVGARFFPPIPSPFLSFSVFLFYALRF